jgi:integrase
MNSENTSWLSSPAHKLTTGGVGLVFGATPDRPFTPTAVRRPALRAWAAANKRIEDPQQKLRPVGLHEARHTCASSSIAAGVNAKALAAFMGHASVLVTFDGYGHLMPGSEDHAAAVVDTYLAAEMRQKCASDSGARGTRVDAAGLQRLDPDEAESLQ